MRADDDLNFRPRFQHVRSGGHLPRYCSAQINGQARPTGRIGLPVVSVARRRIFPSASNESSQRADRPQIGFPKPDAQAYAPS